MTKKILVLDDEEQLSEAVHFFLASKGYEGDYCTTPMKARELLNSNHYDLIISDINMPVQNGIDFFKSVKDELKEKKTGFILMTANVDLISLQDAYDLGVNEFVLKPFDLEDLKIVVDLALLQSNPTFDANMRFYRVSLSEYLLAMAINFDVYLQVDSSYLLIAKKGQELLKARLTNYLKKGVKTIYLNSSDYSKYVDLTCANATEIHPKPQQQMKKVKAQEHLVRFLSNSALSRCIEPEILKRALNYFDYYGQVAFENDDLFEVVQSMYLPTYDLSENSAQVAFLAIAIATHWKWTHPKILSKILLAAFFCQIGVREHPQIVTKKRPEYTGDDIIHFESYPAESLKILTEIPNIPDEVLKVAIQHREDEVGFGFPEALVKERQHPYSRLIHGVVEFLDYTGDVRTPQEMKLSLDKFYSFQKKKVSSQIIKSLFLIFNADVPKELTSLLLPYDTARMT